MTTASTPTAPLILKQLAAGALSPLDLTIAPGEVVCLSGVSGSGKSRLLRAIADLEPHQGEVQLGETNRDQMAASDWRKRVMMVPAESQWWADHVGEHWSSAQPEALSALGLPSEAEQWTVARLSSGEKQRLALVRARASAPRALLLDEPTANLDQDSTLTAERWLLEWIKRDQLPVLWVAHDAEQIQRVADRRLRIQDGRVEAVR
jgi:ABC-type sulfate/molybdate transport systems ATPase subunit